MKKRFMMLTAAISVALIGVGCFAACGKKEDVTLSKAPELVTGLVYTGNAQALVTAGTAVNGTLYYKAGSGAWAEDVPVAVNAGEYAVYYKAEANKGYNPIAETSLGKVTIAKANLDYTAPTKKAGVTYTGSAVTLVNEGTVTGGTIEYKVGSGAWSAKATATEEGDYEIFYRVTPTDAVNYNAVEATSIGTVSLRKDPVTVTTEPVLNNGITYTGSAQQLIATAAVAEGGVVHYKVNDSLWSETLPTGTEAGDYVVSYKVIGDATHSGIPETLLGTVTIAKAELVANTHYTAPEGKTLVNNHSAQQLIDGGVILGSVAGAKFEYKLSTADDSAWSTSLPTGTDVRTYNIDWRISGAVNYNVASGTVQAVISSVKYTAPVGNSNLVYTGSAQALVSHTPSGSDTAGVTIKYCMTESANESDWTTTVPTGTNAGSYTVYYRAYKDGVSEASGSVTANIGKANLVAGTDYTAPAGKTGLAYTGSAQALIDAGTVTGGTISYSKDDGATWSGSVPTGVDAGEYTVYFKITGDSNHNDVAKTQVGSSAIVIGQAANAISSFTIPTAHCHDSIPDTFGATATFGEVAYTFSQDNSHFFTKEQLLATSFKLTAGTYYVKASVAEGSNYEGASVTKSLTVEHNHVWTSGAETDVKACACGDEAGTFNKVVTAARQRVHLDLNRDGSANTTATATIVLTGIDAYESVKSVSYNTTALTNTGLTFNVGGINVKDYGEKNLTVVVVGADGGEHSITVPVFLVTKVITVKEDLTALLPMAIALGDGAQTWNGYFELGADINYGGDYYDTYTHKLGGNAISMCPNYATHGFEGVFDGCGHTISNIQFGTFVTSNSSIWHNGNSLLVGLRGGTVKNLIMTRVSLLTKASAIANWGRGTIENVYITLNKVAPWSATDTNGLSALPAQGDLGGVNITVKNSIVDLTEVQFASRSNGQPIGAAPAAMANFYVLGWNLTFENTYVIYDAAHSTTAVSEYQGGALGTYAIYASYKAMKEAGTNFDSWNGDFWTVETGHLPHCSAMSAYLVTPAFTHRADYIVKGETATFTANANEYVVLSAQAVAAGITLENGVVTVPDNASLLGNTYTVYAYSLFGTNLSVETSFTIIAGNVEYNLNNVTIHLNVGSDGTTSQTVTLDLSSVYNETPDAGSAVAVYHNGIQKGTATIAAGEATFSAANLASVYGNDEIQIIITAPVGNTTINISALFITKIVTNKNELKTVAAIAHSLNGTGYYQLAANVALGGDNWATKTDTVCMIGAEEEFNGIFDGNGYTIDQIKLPVTDGNLYGFIKTLGANGKLMNVKFTNYKPGLGHLVVTGSGSVENVAIDFAFFAGYAANQAYWWGQPAIFGGNNSLKLKNLLVDFDISNSFTKDAGQYFAYLGTFTASATFENVVVMNVNVAHKDHIVRIGTIQNPSEAMGVNVGVYVAYSNDTDNGVTFPATGWNSTYWTVDGGNKTVAFISKS